MISKHGPRILLVADFRSPHAVAWARRLDQMGIPTVGASSRRLSNSERVLAKGSLSEGLAFEVTDVTNHVRTRVTQNERLLAWSRKLARGTASHAAGTSHGAPEGTGRFELSMELMASRKLGRELGRVARHAKPDVIHALRLPFEGISAAGLHDRYPVAISLWGSDLARQAPSSKRLATESRDALERVSGLHADCERDLRLATEWGVGRGVPRLLSPGTMGPDESLFFTNGNEVRDTIFCPRGAGSGIDYLGLIDAADELLSGWPGLRVVLARLEGVTAAEERVRDARNRDRFVLSGTLRQEEMADLYRRSVLVVSPSVSDGTPNSLLEGMLCGALPIAADIEPVRSLLEPVYADGLYDFGSHSSLIAALKRAMGLSAHERMRISRGCRRRVQRHWTFDASRHRVETWYEDVVGHVG